MLDMLDGEASLYGQVAEPAAQVAPEAVREPAEEIDLQEELGRCERTQTVRQSCC